TFGALTLVTAESGRRYMQADRVLVEEIGERAGLAIDNTRLFEAQHRATARLSFLARASDLLAGSLDYPNTFAMLAQLLVTEVADLCLIEVMEEDEDVRWVHALLAIPAPRSLADRLRAALSPYT